jgi:hypothetical protein
MLQKFSTLTGTLNSKIPATEMGILFREPTRLKKRMKVIRTLLLSHEYIFLSLVCTFLVDTIRLVLPSHLYVVGPV